MNEQKNKKQWPAELDALTASPEYHKLLFENEFVRVLDTHIAAGKITNVHMHQYPASLYIVSWSDFIRYDAEGNIMVDSKASGLSAAAGSVLWSEPLAPHAVKNIGENDLHVISVELKNKNE